MRCDHCNQSFVRRNGTQLEDRQVLERGDEWIRARCWNCGNEMVFFKRGSSLNTTAQTQRAKKIQQYKQDLVAKTKEDGVAWGDDEG